MTIGHPSGNDRGTCKNDHRASGNDRGTCKNDRPLVIGYRVVEVGVGRETLRRTASFVSVFTAFGPVFKYERKGDPRADLFDLSALLPSVRRPHDPTLGH
jgi:hypothetical protein